MDDFFMTAWWSKSPDRTYTQPWNLSVGVLSYESRTGHMRLPFRLGSWHFELQMTGSHFPDLLHNLEERFIGDLNTQTKSLVELKVVDKLLVKTKQLGTSLGSYRRVWIVPFDRVEESPLLEIRPGRIIGDEWGLSVDIPDLPAFSWNDIQVLAPVGPDRYKVKAQGIVYECYTPRHAGIFSREIQMWQDITFSPEAYRIRAPKLKGLVRTHLCAPELRGILYDWTEPWPESRSLADVNITQVSQRQREIWYAQAACSIKAVHKLGLRCINRQFFWGHDVVREIIIDSHLNANLSLICFGYWERKASTDEKLSLSEDRDGLRLDTSPEPDLAFLELLRDFLGVNSDQAKQKGAPSHWDFLSSDLRNLIYERVLVDEGPVIYRHGGFVRRNPRTSQIWTSITSNEKPIPGLGLFDVSKAVREESRSLFASQNRFHVEAIEIRNFLGSMGDFIKYLKKITIVIVLSDDVANSRAQNIGITKLQKKATCLRCVEVIVRSSVGDFWRKQLPILALKGIRGLENFEISPRSTGLSLEQCQEMHDYIGLKVVRTVT